MGTPEKMTNKKLYEYYSSVSSTKVEWLWYPYIPFGKITLLQGDPGDGKSTLALNIAAAVTKGGILPDDVKVEKPLNVIYQCPEDGSSDTIKPRLMCAGADCSRIVYIVDAEERLTLDDPRIEKTVADTGARLLVLDPLQSFLRQDGEMQSAGKMRNALQYLSNLAEKYSCAVLLIGHMNKSSGGKMLYRGLGSIDIAAAARSVLMVTRDEENPDIRYLFPIKSSLAPEGSAVGFYMSPENGFQWIGKCNIDTKELKTRTVKRKQGKRELAKDILRVMLSEEDKPAKEILERMEMLGIGNRTARTAQKELGIKAYKKQYVWYWKLEGEHVEENE